jgi:NAD(P)-dependent dehydrogenase (short-subunit alcohol dehydrogenase family)
MVLRFLERGARVAAVDRDAQALEALAADHPQVTTLAADVADPANAERIVGALGERIDVLCNNAGLMDRFALADEVSNEEWQRVFGVNVFAPFLLTKAALPHMVAAGSGVILNTSSIAGLRGGVAGVAYTASKHAVIGLTRNVALTFKKDGVRCNAICPGATGHGARGAIEPGSEFSARGVPLLTKDYEAIGLGTPEQVAAVAVFLASDEAARVNGAVIVVDGGESV